MKIIVKAKPSAKMQSIELIQQTELHFGDNQFNLPVYKVSVKEPAVHGKSNKAIISTLAVFFKVPITSIRILSGRTAKQKIVEIDK